MIKQITDEYAAAVVDTRSRIYIKGGRTFLSLHIPQSYVAKAFVGHFGVGEVNTYAHESRKVFNTILLEGEDALEVLRRVQPHLLSGRRYDAAEMLKQHAL
jgi:hypothetical protein